MQGVELAVADGTCRRNASLGSLGSWRLLARIRGRLGPALLPLCLLRRRISTVIKQLVSLWAGVDPPFTILMAWVKHVNTTTLLQIKVGKSL